MSFCLWLSWSSSEAVHVYEVSASERLFDTDFFVEVVLVTTLGFLEGFFVSCCNVFNLRIKLTRNPVSLSGIRASSGCPKRASMVSGPGGGRVRVTFKGETFVDLCTCKV